MRIILKIVAHVYMQFSVGLVEFVSMSLSSFSMPIKCMHRCLLHLAPTYLASMFLTNKAFGYSYTIVATRDSDKIHLMHPKTEFGKCIEYMCLTLLKVLNYIAIYHLQSSYQKNIAAFKCACAYQLTY